MSDEEWVIDTGVLVRAFAHSQDFDLAALSFAISVLRRHRVALDFQGRVEGEYFRNLRNSVQFWEWWRAMLDGNKITRRDGRLSNRHRRHLVNNLRFHDDDLPFVAVASRGSSKLLATEDSDYTAQVREYLYAALGVAVLSAADALERAAG